MKSSVAAPWERRHPCLPAFGKAGRQGCLRSQGLRSRDLSNGDLRIRRLSADHFGYRDAPDPLWIVERSPEMDAARAIYDIPIAAVDTDFAACGVGDNYLGDGAQLTGASGAKIDGHLFAQPCARRRLQFQPGDA